MKMRIRFVAATLALVLSLPHFASADQTARNAESVAVDIIVARPCWFVATVIGGALFVVSLPVAALSKSVDQTARTLVGKPADATFKRPLGDFSPVEN